MNAEDTIDTRDVPPVVLGQGTSRTEWPRTGNQYADARAAAYETEAREMADAAIARNAANIHAITEEFKAKADAMCSRLTRTWVHEDLTRALDKYLAAYPKLDADTPQIEAAQTLARLLKGGVL